MAAKIVDYIAMGERIRQERINAGLSQEATSERVGLSESFYGHIERGSRKPSIESIVSIANYFGLSLDYLLMDSKADKCKNEQIQAELDNIFRDKSPAQSDFLIRLLKVLSANIDDLQQ